MKRKTAAGYLAELRSIARARGGRLLSPAYLGDSTKLRWRCGVGHRFLLEPSKIKQRRWCPKCSWIRFGERHKAPTEARLRRFVANRGGLILSEKYAGAAHRLRFRCAEGHEWTVTAASVLAGHWCRRCSNAARFAAARGRVLRRLETLARRHGGEVRTAITARGRATHGFRCAKGHEWLAVPSTVERGGWCQVCVRLTYLERLKALATERGGTLLSNVYINDRSRMRFQCAIGHRFEQRPGDATQGAWCPACGTIRAAEKRKAPARARFLARVAERGGVVLAPYVNSQTPLRLRCSAGHEWVTRPGSIATGSWCRECHLAELALHPERRPTRKEAAPHPELTRRLERIVEKKGGKILPPGFRTFAHPIEVRCGRGHTWMVKPANVQDGSWCGQCREEDVMAELRRHAEHLGGECLSERCRSTHDILVWRCAVGHRFEKAAHRVRVGVWCPSCRQFPHGDIERMRQIARERGGVCLSVEYQGAGIKLRWRCREGHVWSAKPGMITKGHWCPRCGWLLSYSRARLSIEVMREMAAERGGTCLSDDYHGNKVPLRWRCARGHAWMARPNRVRQGSWCPVCAHSARGTLDGMRALANEFGGRCLTKSWNNHQRPLKFECARGHSFHAQGATVKSGVWCPKCARPSRPPLRVR